MKRVAAIFVLFIALNSCTKDNDDVVHTELEGSWVLANASCFCAFGENPDFSTHEINFKGSVLIVQNSGEFQFLKDTAGSYSVDGNVITLKNGAQYKYVIKDKTLELTFVDNPDIADDELLLTYEKY
ncbi:hypothetical protein JQC67_05575 [Aurantibacter crassamenti]|uniref:hypothetical protein n=1 Tax=Aurantibacter crassamenti TaxID=1837375 RepID=UPI00193973AA|nr:hypothetical protein [Aurantibacter crassamenti]MBM1105607.1 hypothetical protein [Aurantibacter crassamenti]